MLFAPDYLGRAGCPWREFTAMLLFAISGAMLMAARRTC